MKLRIMLFVAAMVLLATSPAAMAGDFDWFKSFNIQAEADPAGFRARLATRFNIGGVEVNTVLGAVDNPADAYMVLRLGEMSGRPVSYVVDRYNSGKNKGWGALAKSLGIKPGSQEFHALKRGHDLDDPQNGGHRGNGQKSKKKNKKKRK